MDFTSDDSAYSGPANADFSSPGDSKGSQFLADLTGRRAWLAALVLLGAYLVPLLVVWGIAQAAQAGAFGDSVWLALTAALILGPGLVVGLTVKFGGWFQAVSFGEEYMETFSPVAGTLLGWWRFIVQLGSLILVAWVAADVEIDAKMSSLSNASTAALPAYAERAPIPEGWELSSDSFYQSEYAERPNARYGRDYVVPASVAQPEIRSWLKSPDWDIAVDGQEPFGALRNVECDTDSVQCEAEVKPAAGEPVEYTVAVRVMEVNVDRGGELVPAGLLKFEVEYEEAEAP